jgi:hypothetical protein
VTSRNSKSPGAPPQTEALTQLAELIHRDASGEFIAATRGCEVHLFLQQGRLAWGYSTRNRGTFRAYLESACGVTSSDFSEIIEACRRERAPLGETLVRLKLASTEQVSGALRQQIAAAVQELAALGDVPAMFLARDAVWRDHNGTLTFTLDEVLEFALPPKASAALDGAALTRRVRKALPSLEWVAIANASSVIHAEQPPEGSANGPAASEAAALHRATIAQGAHLVFTRNGSTTVGVALADDASSLWGRLSRGTALFEALATFSRLGARPPQARSPLEGDARREGPPDAAFDAVAPSLLRDPTVSAVLTLGDDGRPGPSLTRPTLRVDRLVPRLVLRSTLLAQTSSDHPNAASHPIAPSHPELPNPVASPSPDPAPGLRLPRDLSVADELGWWFGAPTGHSITWILTSASLSPGLGLAFLRTMTTGLRRLSSSEADSGSGSAGTSAPAAGAPRG